MANELASNLFSQPYTTAEALLAYRAVNLTSAGLAQYPNAATEPLLGVTVADVASGAIAEVRHLGTARLTVNGNSVNIAPGDWLVVTGTAGICVKWDTTADTTANAIGMALAPSTADGDVISVLLMPTRFSTESS